MKKNINHYLVLYLRYIAGITVIVVLVKLFKLDNWKELANVNWLSLLAGFAASLAANLIGAFRWGLTVKYCYGDQRLPFIIIFHHQTLSNLLSITGLGAMLGLAARTMFLKITSKISLKKNLQSLMLDRIYDILVLLLACLPSIGYATGIIKLNTAISIIYSSILLLLFFSFVAQRKIVIVLDCFFRIAVSLTSFLRRCKNRLWRNKTKEEQKTNAPSEMHEPADGLVNVNSVFLSFLTIARLFFLTLRLLFIAVALGESLPFGFVFIGMIVLQVSLFLSPTPGALGVAELGWIAVLTQYGLDPSSATLLSLGFRIYLTIFNVGAYVLSLLAKLLLYAKNAPVIFPVKDRIPNED